MTKAETAVVSLATGPFEASLARLERSLDRVGFVGARKVWRPGEFPADCPSHAEVPFAFKPFCLAEAAASGFRRALWLDSTCVAIRSLDPLFARLETDGYLLFRNGGLCLGNWASDAALAAFGVDREVALRLPEVNAAAVGLDVTHPDGARFLSSWHAAARAGTPFRGVEEIGDIDEYWAVRSNRAERASKDARVHGHRHDQTVAGILAYQFGLQLTTTAFQEYRLRRGRIRPTTLVVNCRRAGRFDGTRIALGRLAGHLLAPRGFQPVRIGVR
jgi:hypothetical protein